MQHFIKRPQILPGIVPFEPREIVLPETILEKVDAALEEINSGTCCWGTTGTCERWAACYRCRICCALMDG